MDREDGDGADEPTSGSFDPEVSPTPVSAALRGTVTSVSMDTEVDLARLREWPVFLPSFTYVSDAHREKLY